MQSISAFLGITKVADFPGKKWWCQQNSEICHVIYIFFRSSFGKAQLCHVLSL